MNLLSCAQIRALEKDIRKQVLKAAELKFEASKQVKNGGVNSSAAIVSASLAMPKSISQAVTLAVKDVEQKSKAEDLEKSKSELHEISTQHNVKAPRSSKRSEWTESKVTKHSWLDSSSIFEAGSREDRERQHKFHAELLRIRQDVVNSQIRRKKELAKQRLLFKIRALQTARHLEQGGSFHVKSKAKTHDEIKSSSSPRRRHTLHRRKMAASHHEFAPPVEHVKDALIETKV